MGAWGGIIMSFFGALFVSLTLWHERGWIDARLALPFLVFAAIALAATAVIRRPGTGVAPSPRAEKVIMWASIGEGIGLFLASTIVANLHHPEWLLPSMALVVGLHFVPMAIAIPFRPFGVLSAALLIAAALGFTLAPPLGAEIAGFTAAAALWVAALLAVNRDAKAKRS